MQEGTAQRVVDARIFFQRPLSEGDGAGHGGKCPGRGGEQGAGERKARQHTES